MSMASELFSFRFNDTPDGGWPLLDKILQVSSNYHYCNCNFYCVLIWASGSVMWYLVEEEEKKLFNFMLYYVLVLIKMLMRNSGDIIVKLDWIWKTFILIGIKVKLFFDRRHLVLHPVPHSLHACSYFKDTSSSYQHLWKFIYKQKVSWVLHH